MTSASDPGAFWARVGGAMRNGELWAITSHFNPVGFRRPRENFERFRDALGVPLLAAEVYDSTPSLGAEDADIVLSLQGEPAIWQKERLLNLALEALPPEARYVAWLDCDILFVNEDWGREAVARLEAGAEAVHPFECAISLGPDGSDGPLLEDVMPGFDVGLVDVSRRISFAALHARDPEQALSTFIGEQAVLAQAIRSYGAGQALPVIGYAWVAERARIARTGFFDRNIVGGGDSVMLAALCGRRIEAGRRPFSPAHLAEIHSYGERFGPRGWSLGHCAGDIKHLWHGAKPSRQYFSRYAILTKHRYDPARDLRLAPNGTWAWAEPDGPLARDVRRFFERRREDG